MNLKPKEEQKRIIADPDGYIKMREERRKRDNPDSWRDDPDSWLFEDKESYLSWKNGDINLEEYLGEDCFFPDDSVNTTPQIDFTDDNLTAK